jgi:hypothetical protein
MDGLENLDADERVQFAFMLLSVFRVYETTFYQYQVGAAEEPLFRSMENDIAVVLGSAGARQWWRENPFVFSPEFRSHVESLANDRTPEEKS